MKLIWFARPSAVVAAVFVLAALLNAALAAREEALEPPLLAGRLLVASPQMGDPRFYRAVILVVRHDRNGAGFVCERQIASGVARDGELSGCGADLPGLDARDRGVRGVFETHLTVAELPRSVAMLDGAPRPELGIVTWSQRDG